MKIEVGTRLRAINPCVMEETGKPTLTVGKDYYVQKRSSYYFVITDDDDDDHEFLDHDASTFFDIVAVCSQSAALKVKIKKLHPDAVIPTYARPGDAGMDLTAVSNDVDEHGNHVYNTGLAFELPEGYVGLLFPRSSVSRTGMSLRNAVGVLDSGFRAEVTLKFSSENGVRYKVGDRVGQIIIMPYPRIEFQEVEELSETERGTGGYGSTGN